MLERIREILSRYATNRDARRERASAAQLWLKDETFNSALAKMRLSAVDKWLASSDPETQQKVWLYMQGINEFVRELEVFVDLEKAEQIQEYRDDLKRGIATP